jgi:hypothetical protein
MSLQATMRTAALPLVALAVAALPLTIAAQDRRIPETYTAVTTGMTPADVELKADILQWSSDEQRAAVVAALTESDDPVAALQELPTLGVVWRNDSAVGSAIKYAQRETAADGSETITLVTDKRVGATSFNPWVADGSPVAEPPPYSIIQMNVGDGIGTMSLAAEAFIDTGNATVALDTESGLPVLTKVMKAPKPYWAKASD